MADRGPQIEVKGLSDFRRAMKSAGPETTKIINAELRTVAETVAARAASLAPRRTGRLAASLRPFAAGNKVGVRSRLPYAGVIHWGGTTGRGHTQSHRGATTIKESLFITRAVASQETQIVESLGQAMERALERLTR